MSPGLGRGRERETRGAPRLSDEDPSAGTIPALLHPCSKSLSQTGQPPPVTWSHRALCRRKRDKQFPLAGGTGNRGTRQAYPPFVLGWGGCCLLLCTLHAPVTRAELGSSSRASQRYSRDLWSGSKDNCSQLPAWTLHTNLETHPGSTRTPWLTQMQGWFGLGAVLSPFNINILLLLGRGSGQKGMSLLE